MISGVVEVLQSVSLGPMGAHCMAPCMTHRVQVPRDLPSRAARSLRDA